MIHFRLFFLVLILAACSESTLKGAGIVAYSKANDGNVYILLADHNFPQAHRGYGAFGGGIDEAETIQAAALREFHEETQCRFDLLELKLHDDIYYNQDKSFVSLAISVPFTDFSKTFKKETCQGGVYEERSDWRWVSINDLQSYLASPQNAPIEIWQKSAVILQQVLDASPWEESE